MAAIRDVAVMTYFHIHQESIAQQYCINLNKPEVMCKAKCYLNELLTPSAEEQEQLMLTSIGEKIQLILLEDIHWDNFNVDGIDSSNNWSYQVPVVLGYFNSILRPPEALLS